MEDRRIEDKRIEINRRLREIQDEVALNKKEQACINEIIDEINDMKHMYASFNEERLAYWAGTEFGREVAELNTERETLYRELIRDAEDGIEEAKKEKSRAYHRAYSKEYPAKNIEKCREYEKVKAREYQAKKKIQATT